MIKNIMAYDEAPYQIMQKNDNTIVNPNPPRGGGHVLRKQRSCESYLDTERRITQTAVM